MSPSLSPDGKSHCPRSSPSRGLGLTLSRGGTSSSVVDPTLSSHSSLSTCLFLVPGTPVTPSALGVVPDSLLYDKVSEYVAPRRQRGDSENPTCLPLFSGEVPTPALHPPSTLHLLRSSCKLVGFSFIFQVKGSTHVSPHESSTHCRVLPLESTQARCPEELAHALLRDQSPPCPREPP